MTVQVATGTNLVVALDDHLILKIFPPMLRSQFVSERGALALLAGRLSIAIPQIVCEGERDQWPYLVITRLPGMLGAEAWPAGICTTSAEPSPGESCTTQSRSRRASSPMASVSTATAGPL